MTENFGNLIAKVSEALDILRDNEGELGELLGQAKFHANGDLLLTPSTMAQLLMEVLPLPENNARLSTEQKLYWMKVAEYMGPDWIGELRRIAAFMDKIDQF